MHSEENAKKEIFIDSVRNDEKYPGSSLFQSHRGVRESIAKFEDTFMYSVDTVSLSSLMTQTLWILMKPVSHLLIQNRVVVQKEICLKTKILLKVL